MSDLSAFRYKARDAEGRRRDGTVAAVDEVDALRRLRADGLLPVDLIANPQATTRTTRRTPWGRRTAMSARARADFVTRLGKLTDSRIDLDRALTIMSEGRSGPIQKAAVGLRTHMREGGTLLDGLRDHAKIDDPATLALVRGAEASGDLPGALTTAGSLLTQRLALRRKVVTGLLYPSLLLVVAMIAVGVIMVAIIPQFRPLIEDRMDAIPPLGRLIFALSAMVSGLWRLLLFGVAAMLGVFMWLHGKGQAGALLRRATARLPLLRDVVGRGQVTITLHVLGALLTREVTLSEALRTVTEGLPDGPVRSALEAARREVEGGAALSASLRDMTALAPSAVEMIRIGEETGDLAGMLGRAAAEMREASDRGLERFLALFQPALIVGVGLIVGVSLYALFSAIVAVNSIAL
ncbi:type II secretion system F family protein [Jannaschia aquimarina]|uniref:EpsF protein n=1 Tax=Jannaschia aquimarina TaxID=935700 RepID=A0A0D1EG50_9RHOB|nr:type II secretion system F family protein [Jannaschia aquimarina]KIT15866.1 Type II secretion system protein F [Jannaschia aquimarina]SNT10360.1 type II secretion system protein F (GspF) [Jannaschia aquimarina]